MKKNISINISGIIFHIEEDAYNNLKTYLETINKYFSTYEDSLEIISDIENRVAEIFLSKLNEEKQVITSEDVGYLTSTMGTIADFEAAETSGSFADEERQQNDAYEEKSAKYSQNDENENPPKEDAFSLGKEKVFRDEKRKVVGGVASGFAYFFSMDPLWIRLLLVVVLLNVFNLGISGAVFITYIILWLVLPGSVDLGDEESVKKMFRSSENQVLGGVGSGLAAYFGIDSTVIRLLFVISIPFGGFILYLILWMITPLAKTITEKMQMQGEPVTLSNIQQSVTKNLSNSEGEESPVAKILLFPFRVIAEIFKVIVKLIGPIGKVLFDVIRVFSGVVISFVGVLLIIAIVVVLLMLLGVLHNMPEYMVSSPVPIDIISGSFSPVLYVAAFLCLVIPMLFITMIGVSLVVKRFVVNVSLGWSLLGVWLIGVLIISFTVPQIVMMFNDDGYVKERISYDVDSDKPLVLKMNFEGSQNKHAIDFEIKPSQDSLVRLLVKKMSHGVSKEKAIENAKMIDYQVVQDKNTLVLDSKFEFKTDAKFRGQTLDLVLYMPAGQVFVLDEDMSSMLSKREGRKFSYFGSFDEDYQWVYNADGLTCLNCQSSTRKSTDSDENKEASDSEKVIVELEGFNELEVHGFYNVKVRQGDEFKIDIKSSSNMSEYIAVEKYDDLLVLDFEKNDWNLLEDIKEDNEIKVFITMPELKQIKGSGVCTFDVRGFSEDVFEVEMSGAAQCELSIDTQELNVELSGASKIEMSGTTDYLNADVSGASSIRAYKLLSQSVNLSASGASSARITVTDDLNAEASGFSNVRYKGNPDVRVIDKDGMGSIRSSDD